MKIKIILLVILLSSCTTLKYAANEKITAKNNCSVFTLNTFAAIEAELENKKYPFILDTGAMVSILLDSTAIENFGEKKLGSFGTNLSADKTKKHNRFFTAKISSPLFESENKMLSLSLMPESICSKGKYFKGIIGLDMFFEDKTALILDFTKNEICNIGIAAIPQKLNESQGYKLLKSECRQNQIFVYLTIEGKEFKFQLDTGYTGNMIIPKSEKVEFYNKNIMVLEGALYTTISSFTTGTEIYYEKMPMVFAGENFDAKVNVSSSIKVQNMGINFIKNFDWIIDYSNNKVYVKRNQNKIESNFNRRVSYYAKAVKDKLIISTKEKSQTKYNLGDEIISVNGKKVTTENACEIQDFLNKTEDWNALQLEVIRASN
jgi:predicted aspartyl protease